MKRILFQKWLIIALCLYHSISPTLQAQFLNPDRRTLENNKICNDPIVGTGITAPSVLSGISVCVLCGSGGSNVVDGDISNFGGVSLATVGVLGNVLAAVQDGLQYYPAGNRVGFVIRNNGSLLQANLLSSLEIQTYRNGTLVNTANTSGGISLGVLDGSNSKQIISFITTSNFDEVRLVSRGIVNAGLLAGGLEIYYAFEEPASCQVDCTKPIVNNGAPNNFASGATASSDIALCRDADNENLLIDSDLTNYGQLGVLASILGCYANFEVTATQDYPAGTEAGFVISGVALLDLLPVSLLNNITIETVNSSGGTVQTKTGADLLAVNLLGSSSKTKVGFVTNAPFRKIKITFGGILSTLRAYYAYVVEDSDNDGIPNCRDNCATASTTDTDGDGLFNPCDLNEANLVVTTTSSPASPVALNSNVTFTTNVTEIGQSSTTGVTVQVALTPGLTYVSHTAPAGTNYDPATGIWTIGSALLGDISSLDLVIVTTVTAPGISTGTATLTLPPGQTETSPGNNSSSACVSVPYQICSGGSIVLTASSSGLWYKDGISTGVTAVTFMATQSGAYSTSPTCTTGNCCFYVNVNTPPTPTLSAGAGAGAGNAACLPLSGSYPVSLTLGGCPGGTFTIFQTKNGTQTALASGISATPYNFNLTAAVTGNTTDTYTFSAACNQNGCTGTQSAASNAITLTTQPAGPSAPVASAGAGAGTASCLPINGTYPVSLALGTCVGGTFTVFQTKNGSETTLASGVASPYTFSLAAAATSNTTDTYTFSATCTISGCTSAKSAASNIVTLTTQPAAPPAPTVSTILSAGDLLCLNLGAIVPVTVNLLGSCPGGTLSLFRTKNGVVREQVTLVLGLDNLIASSSTDIYVYSTVCTVNGCSSPDSPLSANLTLSTNCNGADLQITNSVLPSNPSLNQNVTFTTTVTEIGNGNFTNVVVTETFTNGLTYVSHVAPPGTSYNPATGIWTIGNALTPAEISSLTLSIVATVANPGVSTNTATLTSGDNTPSNNSSTVCVSVPYQICTGGSVVLTAPTAGQWYRNGVIIVGQTGSTYTATLGGTYTNTSLLQAINCTNNCCFVVNEIQTTAPTIAAGPASGNNTNASCLPVNTPYPISLTLGTCAGGTFTIFQSKNGGAETTLATGITNSPYNLTLTSSVTAGTTDTYVFSATCTANGCSSSRSGNSTITLSTRPAAPNAPTAVALNLTIDQLLCLGVGTIVPVTITPNGSCPGGILTLFRTRNGVRTQVQLLAGIGSELLTVNSTTDVFAYSVVCTINGCSSPDSPTATITLSNKPATPTFTNKTRYVCKKSTVNVGVNNCNGSIAWSTGQTTSAPNNTITITAPNSGSVTVTAICTIAGCASETGTIVLETKELDITIIDVNQSGSKDLGGVGQPITAWNLIYPFNNTPIAPGVAKSYGNASQSGPELEGTTPSNRRIFDQYQTPRYWTTEVKICDNLIAPNVGSIVYEMLVLDPITDLPSQTLTSYENFGPYLQFGNTEAYTKLYTLNDVAFGFPSSSTGIYDQGFPKGKYNYRVRVYNKRAVDIGPYPSNITRIVDPTASVLLEVTYYINITNANGARTGTESVAEVDTEFASVAPNPVTRTLTTTIKRAKGQIIKLNFTDMTGRLLWEKEVTPTANEHHEQVDVSNQPTGVYFMQVVSPSKRATLKVVKMSND